jgi:hypothetical protein
VLAFTLAIVVAIVAPYPARHRNLLLVKHLTA